MKTKQSFFHALKDTGVRLLSVVEVRLPSLVEALSLILLSFVLFLISCQRSTAPVYNPQKLQLTIADVSCTEAWLHLKAEQTEETENEKDLVLQVFRDDSLVVNKNWGAGDSLVYIEGLQPATAYAFSAKLLQDNKPLAASPKVTATTMDTTSHDFIWQTFEFGGQGGSSSFYDVAIIDENDIWAVGEIYTADDKYNAAHWNGEKWELKKIANDSYPRRVVYAFGKNDVWFDGSIKWDGLKYTVHMKNFPLLSNGDGWYENAMWGASSEDFYLVGDHGMIAHYDGQQWQRIESGTTAHFKDIYGNNNYIVCSATHYDYGGKKQVFQIKKGGILKNLNWPFDDRKPYSIWLKNKYTIYACGDGIFRKIANHEWKLFNDENTFFMRNIRGNDHNDIYVVDDFGQIFHFNGLSWKFIFNKDFPNGHLYSIDLNNKLIISVGHKGRASYLVMLFR